MNRLKIIGITIVIVGAIFLGYFLNTKTNDVGNLGSIYNKDGYINSTNPLEVQLASTIAGEDITNDVLKTEQRYSRYATTTAQTAVIKSGAGFLHSMTIHSTSTMTSIGLYDSTTVYGGTLIATTTFSTGSPVTLFFDNALTNGLSMAVVGGALNITVNYR